MRFNPPDHYKARGVFRAFQNVEDSLSNQQRPKKGLRLTFAGRTQCSRKQYPNYFPQSFDDECKGSGKAEYNILVSKKSQGQHIGTGTHTFCKKCLDEYISKTGPYKDKGDRLESPERTLYIYKLR